MSNIQVLGLILAVIAIILWGILSFMNYGIVRVLFGKLVKFIDSRIVKKKKKGDA